MAVVERAFVISLPFRRDRLLDFREQFSGIECLPEIELWPAIHGDTCPPPESWNAGNGAWGCYRSHLGILEYCLNNRVSSYIVFEDDAQLRRDLEFDSYLQSAFDQLPEDWEQFYLGGQLMHTNSHPPKRIGSHVYRPFNVNRTHCFAVSRAGMAPIYRHICNLPFVGHDHIDHHLGRWHEDAANRVFCTARWLVGQHGSSSNVSGKNEPIQFYQDADQLGRDHWLFTDPVCVLFRASPSLIRECTEFLHFGNTINAMGYDVTLHEATKYKYPGPSLSKWFGWICGEIASEGSNRLPAVFHPQIDEKLLREHVAKKVVVIEHAASVKEIQNQIREAIPQWAA